MKNSLDYVVFLLYPSAISRAELESVFIPYDLKRLEMYSRNMVDYHLIMDMVPTIARMFFLNQMGDITLSAAQSVCITVRTSHASPLFVYMLGVVSCLMSSLKQTLLQLIASFVVLFVISPACSVLPPLAFALNKMCRDHTLLYVQ